MPQHAGYDAPWLFFVFPVPLLWKENSFTSQGCEMGFRKRQIPWGSWRALQVSPQHSTRFWRLSRATWPLCSIWPLALWHLLGAKIWGCMNDLRAPGMLKCPDWPYRDHYLLAHYLNGALFKPRPAAWPSGCPGSLPCTGKVIISLRFF